MVVSIKKIGIILCFLLFPLAGYAVITVSLDKLNADGWNNCMGQEVCFSHPLMVCGIFSDSLLLSTDRLFVPEETAVGLAQGDSAEYYRISEQNALHTVRLQCPHSYSLCLGATVRHLKAVVVGNHRLLTGAAPAFVNPVFKKKKPVLPQSDIVVCCANIQNYFVHLGGYASQRTTEQQHSLQRLKTATALCRLDADIYALCELEKGSAAPSELTAELNRIAGQERYDFLFTDSIDGDTISVGVIYRKDKVRPFGKLLFAYNASDSTKQVYARRFILQGFESIKHNECFVLSLNHLRSKRGGAQEALYKRIDNVKHILACIDKAYNMDYGAGGEPCYSDPDIMIVGDFNAYAQELPLQMIVDAGYGDMLQPRYGKIITRSDSLIYTYSYKGLCGSLDRVYASPSMAAQINYICPVHWNADYYYSAAYWSHYNFTKNKLTSQARKNICFRYSDHDPLLIGISFVNQP